MIPSLSIGPRPLLNDCNHSATAIFWKSAIEESMSSTRHAVPGEMSPFDNFTMRPDPSSKRIYSFRLSELYPKSH